MVPAPFHTRARKRANGQNHGLDPDFGLRDDLMLCQTAFATKLHTSGPLYAQDLKLRGAIIREKELIMLPNEQAPRSFFPLEKPDAQWMDILFQLVGCKFFNLFVGGGSLVHQPIRECRFFFP